MKINKRRIAVLAVAVILAVVGAVVATGGGANAEPREMQVSKMTKDGGTRWKGSKNFAWCQVVYHADPTRYATHVRLKDGSQYTLHGWRVKEAATSSPIKAGAWEQWYAPREGESDRRVTRCRAGYYATWVWTRDGALYRVWNLTIS